MLECVPKRTLLLKPPRDSLFGCPKRKIAILHFYTTEVLMYAEYLSFRRLKGSLRTHSRHPQVYLDLRKADESKPSALAMQKSLG